MTKKKKKNKGRIYTHALLNSKKHHSRFAEAYRMLRTNLPFLIPGKKLQTMIITSSGQSEGKTVTVFNLAYTIALAGKSILVIDADLRKPMLSRLYDIEKNHQAKPKGLTGILSELMTIDIRSGSLEEYGISDLLKLVSLQKKSGILSIEDDHEKVEVIFSDGIPKDVKWLTRPKEKRLINMLVRTGFLKPEQAILAEKQRVDTGQDLGFILINMGFMDKTRLKGPLTVNTAEAINVISRMKTGKFHFEPKLQTYHTIYYSELVKFDDLYDQSSGIMSDFPYLSKKIFANIISTDMENLFLLPSGVIPPNPSELLGSAQMPFLLSILKRKFDMIIMDTPPILPASDALILAPHTDGVALVVKSGALKRNMIHKAIKQVKLTKANLLGVILNNVDVKKEGYYKYYDKYYTGYYSQSK